MRRQRYASDLTPAQFTRLAPLLPPAKPGGRPRQVDLYDVICAILYVLQNGCTWRNLPHDFPAWQTVYWYFRQFQQDGTWEAVNRFLLRRTRNKAQRDPEPSAGIIDAQTVRCSPQAGLRGVDAGKKTNGRKRHVVVDTLGLLLMVFVTAGSVQDRVAAPILLGLLAKRFPRLRHIWADAGYSGEVVTWAWSFLRWTVEVVNGMGGQRGFVVRPRRWVVERSLAWLTRSRRLVRDYEGLPETTEAWVYIANIRLMLRRLHPAT